MSKTAVFVTAGTIGPSASSCPTAKPSRMKLPEPLQDGPVQELSVIVAVLSSGFDSVTFAPSMCGIGFGPKLCSDCVCGSPPYQTPSCDVSP